MLGSVRVCAGAHLIILLSLVGCDNPFSGSPDYITPRYGIKVWFKDHVQIDNVEKVGLYIDTAEASLRGNGIRSRFSNVALYGVNELELDGKKVGGIARRCNIGWGIRCVWYPLFGAYSYSHERLHQACAKHKDWSLKDLEWIDNEAIQAGYQAAFGI